MTANRQTRRRQQREQQQPATPTLEQRMAAAATVAPPPLVINLDNCRVITRDIPDQEGSKELLFAHISGGVVFRALISPTLRRELATLLSTPPGIVIPPTADTPAA
jgi:hypothetical protein